MLPKRSSAQGSGHCLTLNGTNQAVDLGDTVANGCRTIEMWFKPSTNITSVNSSPRTLICRDYLNGSGLSTDEFFLTFSTTSWSAGGKLLFGRRIGSAVHNIYSDANSWPANHWFHVAVTLDSISGMKMYINGILQLSSNSSTNPIGTQSGSYSDNVAIGKWGSFSMRYFNGNIDEVRLWENARTQTQIQESMCRSLTGNEPMLRAYYRADLSNGSVLVDSSPNNLDGTVVTNPTGVWNYSGAPIGDTSSYIYNNFGLSGTTLSLANGIGDSLVISSLPASTKGAHIYKVNAVPNTLTGAINSLTQNYYGVFLADQSASYDLEYWYSNYQCSGCELLFARNENSVMQWSPIVSSPISCNFSIANQSSIGYPYRSEYVISGNPFQVSSVLGSDTTLCTGDSLHLNASYPYAIGYLWNDGTVDSTKTITQSGAYSVKITDAFGCDRYDTIIVNVRPIPIVALQGGGIYCLGDTVILSSANSSIMSYLWQNGSVNSSLAVSNPGYFYLEVTDSFGCIGFDSTEVIFRDIPQIDLGEDTAICEGDTFQIMLQGMDSLNFIWSTGSTALQILINQSGTYWIEVSDSFGCFNSDTLEILQSSIPDFNLGKDTLICDDEQWILSVSEPGLTYEWSTGEITQSIQVMNSGLFWAIARENSCTSSDSVIIELIDCYGPYDLPNVITPNGDGYNDVFRPFEPVSFMVSIETLIYNRWGKLMYKTNDPYINWDGRNMDSGEYCSDGVYYYVCRRRAKRPQGLSELITLTGTITILDSPTRTGW